MSSVSDLIKQKAFELGFHKIGFAKAEVLGDESNHLKEWLKNKFNGSMLWMERNISKRINPMKILPDAKSVVVVAINYYNSLDISNNSDVLKISRYALKADYHKVLGKRLQKLLQYIKMVESSADGVCFVDSGPIMEKAWAVRAGIGWQGKHTITITKEYGSWIFLGELILNIELEYDSSAVDLCGECTLCIEACPSNAIVEPYVLDAKNCISYLTIESKEKIPESISKKMDGWVYGCDICQEVCPWNQKYSKQTDVVEFSTNEKDSFHLSPIMMTREQFEENFKHTPIERIGYDRFKRNVQMAIENQKYFKGNLNG